jgi:propane monooxygenase large subunit
LSRQSLTKAHAKITELSWEPTFATPATRFGTDYTFEKAPKRSAQADHAVLLPDGGGEGQLRSAPWMAPSAQYVPPGAAAAGMAKLFLGSSFPRDLIARAMPMAIDAVPNPEIHNGLAVQMIDEVRH